MSKTLLAFLLLAECGGLLDPPRALGLLGPRAQTLAWKLVSALDVRLILPRLSYFGAR